LFQQRKRKHAKENLRKEKPDHERSLVKKKGEKDWKNVSFRNNLKNRSQDRGSKRGKKPDVRQPLRTSYRGKTYKKAYLPAVQKRKGIKKNPPFV